MDKKPTVSTNDSINKIVPYVPGKPIATLERELGIKNSIKLASNENPLGPSPAAISAAQAAIHNARLYPDGAGHELKSALAAHLQLTPEQFILGDGSDNIFTLVTQAFISRDDTVLIAENSFPTYSIVTHSSQAKLDYFQRPNWQYDVTEILSKVTKRTKLLFIGNPDNPIPSWLKQNQLTELLQQLPKHVLVVLDEAYAEYIDAPDYPNSPNLCANFPNLLVTRTFSKAYALAGLRIGYAFGHPDIIDILNRVRLPFNVSQPSQDAARAALGDHEHLKASLDSNQQGLHQLCKGLDDLGLKYACGPNFVTIALQNDAMQTYQQLLKEGIITRPLSSFGLNNYLRISTGRPEEITLCLQALNKCLNN